MPTIRYAKAASQKAISTVDRLIAESENQAREQQEDDELDACNQYEQDLVDALVDIHEPSPNQSDIDALTVADEKENRIEDAFEEDEEVEDLLETHGVGVSA